MSDDDFLVCGDVPMLRGSVWDFCSRCGGRVTIAPTGQKLRAEHNLKVVCMNCAPDDLELLQPPTAEQLREIAEYEAAKRGSRQ